MQREGIRKPHQVATTHLFSYPAFSLSNFREASVQRNVPLQTERRCWRLQVIKSQKRDRKLHFWDSGRRRSILSLENRTESRSMHQPWQCTESTTPFRSGSWRNLRPAAFSSSTSAAESPCCCISGSGSPLSATARWSRRT